MTPESTLATGVAPDAARERIRATVLDVLGRIAPELDAAGLKADVELRSELDLDSMDFLNFVIGLHEAFGIDIPEADYRKLATLDHCVAYVAARTGA
jgi:acyl carrier protein